MRMKNVIAMDDKEGMEIVNSTMGAIVRVFELASEPIMTKSEIIDRIKAYQEILNEEFKLENNE